jgi:hypothetical protein
VYADAKVETDLDANVDLEMRIAGAELGLLGGSWRSGAKRQLSDWAPLRLAGGG